jgi:hypothetical protein
VNTWKTLRVTLLQANGTEEERFNLTTLARLVADGNLTD